MARFKKLSLDEARETFTLLSEAEQRAIKGGCSGCEEARGYGYSIYTKDEFEQMLEAGTWTGGYVCGQGIVLGSVTIEGEYGDSYSHGYGKPCFLHNKYYPLNGSCPDCDALYGEISYGDSGYGDSYSGGDNSGSFIGGGGGGGNYPEATISWGSSADKDVISNKTIATINKLSALSGDTTFTITSTLRTPADQARIMYENILKTSIENQKSLYGNYGDMIIDEYSKCISEGITDADVIKERMTLKIEEVGAQNVSKHCGDPNKINVF